MMSKEEQKRMAFATLVCLLAADKKLDDKYAELMSKLVVGLTIDDIHDIEKKVLLMQKLFALNPILEKEAPQKNKL